MEEHDPLPLEHPEGEDGEEEKEQVDQQVQAVHQVGLRLRKVSVYLHLSKGYIIISLNAREQYSSRVMFVWRNVRPSLENLEAKFCSWSKM